MNQIDYNNTVFFDFITEFLSRDRFNDTLLLDICEYMLEGNLVVRYSHVPKTFTYEEKLKFTPETIDWDMAYDNNTNLCQLYLHSLEPVKYLIQGYEITKKESYLQLALRIIYSWVDYSHTDYVNRFPWYDHCVSDRTLYLIYFIEMVKKHDIPGYMKDIEVIESLLIKQAEYLFDDKNYTTQNHGTMMDRSLYLVSRYSSNTNSEAWRSKALNRLRESITRDFSDNMVNLENSSSYHLFNFDLFVVIEKSLLNVFGDSLGADFHKVINKGIDYMVHLAKPDLNFPVMGDGSKFSFSSIKNHPSYKFVNNHEEMQYVLSGGNEGREPKELFKVYEDEGYAFMRNSWDYKHNRNNITYLSFIAGYKLKNHKHGDDLSFTLFSKGKDIFVDCGTFTYQAGDFRRHFMSALSHNTVVVDGKSYPFIQGNPQDTGILDYGEEKGYRFVVGKNDLYPGVNITRSVLFLNSGNIVIVDDALSNKFHTYSQLFHLSHRLNLNKIKFNNGEIQIMDTDIAVTVKQICQTESFIHRGDKTKANLGLVSEGFNSMHESTTLEYQVKGKTARFITLISVNENDEDTAFDASLSGDALKIIEGNTNFSISLNTKNRTLEEGVFLDEVKVKNNKYRFTIIGAKPNVDFAWYIMRNGERVDVLWYTDSPEIEYTFNEKGQYEIQYFIRNKMDNNDKVRYIYENKIKI